MDVTVTICTSNRSDKLEGTLDAMTRLVLPPELTWELVVVDNNSTDRTREVTEAFESRLPIRYLFHAVPGLGGARNVAFRAAGGQVIACTDDDCIVEPNWLAEIWREFRSDPDLAGLGGRVELRNPLDLPICLRTYPHRLVLQSPAQFKAITGANMAFARWAVSRIGLFDDTLGAGTRITSAEDSDYVYRLLRSGLKLLYSPSILVYHDHGRRLQAQAVALKRNYAIGRGALYCKHIRRGDREMMRIGRAEVLRHLRQSAGALRRLEPVLVHARPLWQLCVGARYQIASRRTDASLPRGWAFEDGQHGEGQARLQAGASSAGIPEGGK